MPTDRPSPHAADAANAVVGFTDPVRGQTHFTVAEYFPSDIRERMRREGRITVDRDWFYRVVNGAIVGHDAGTPVKSGGTLTMWLKPFASAAPAPPPQQQAAPPTDRPTPHAAALERLAADALEILLALHPRPELRGMDVAANQFYGGSISVNHLQRVKSALQRVVGAAAQRADRPSHHAADATRPPSVAFEEWWDKCDSFERAKWPKHLLRLAFLMGRESATADAAVEGRAAAEGK